MRVSPMSEDNTNRGHNGGPPLEDPPDHVPEWEDGDPNLYFQWKAAFRRARRSAPHDIVMFRLSRAEAAGVDYEVYLTEVLERGRRMQAGDDPDRLKNRFRARKR
jgi:hypothetical protein